MHTKQHVYAAPNQNNNTKAASLSFFWNLTLVYHSWWVAVSEAALSTQNHFLPPYWPDIPRLHQPNIRARARPTQGDFFTTLNISKMLTIGLLWWKNMQCLEHTNIQSKSIFRAASWSRWPCAWWGSSSQGPTCSLWTSRLTVLRVYRIYCWSFLLKVNNNLRKYLLQDPIYFPISASGLSTALIVSAPYPYPYNAAPPLYPKLPLGSLKMANRVSKGTHQFTECSNQHSLNIFFDLSRCCMRKGHKGKNKKVKWWNGKELQKFPIDRLTEALVTICYFTYRIDKKYLTT